MEYKQRNFTQHKNIYPYFQYVRNIVHFYFQEIEAWHTPCSKGLKST